MVVVDFFIKNYVMLFELIGLMIVLKISVHISERVRKLTEAVVILLLLESLAFHLELWTHSFSQLSLLRPMLTALLYSLYPIILIIAMQITAMKTVPKKWLILMLIPLLICIPIYFTSQWTQLVFWHDDSNRYQGGPLSNLPYAVFGFYALLFLIWNLDYFRNSSPINRVFASYIILGPIIGVVLYIVFQTNSDYSALFTSGLVLYYICIYIHTAKTDPLTGLLNRQSYYQDLKDGERTITAAVSVDMNELKYLNDTFGHEAGDTALKAISKVLLEHSGEKGTAYRVGGDEFMLLYINADEAYIKGAITDMRRELAETEYTCAFGYAMRRPGEPVDIALTEADAKMYENKTSIKQAMQERGETLHNREDAFSAGHKE
jgi:diguanylate cyclase (GGDEF)-like protein